MGVLDGLLSEVTSSVDEKSAQQSGLVGSVLSMLSQQGGLDGLIQGMKAKGLDGIASSWVGTGPNQAISGDQVQQVLGNQQLEQLAQQHGLKVDEIKSHLTQILPVAVDKLTPNGTLPTEGGLGGILKSFMPGKS